MYLPVPGTEPMSSVFLGECVMQVFQKSGTKIHKKRREIFGSASTPRQDVKHTGLSGSRGRPAVGSGCFIQTGLELRGQALKP